MGQPNPKKMKPSLVVVLFAVIIAIFYFLFYMQSDDIKPSKDSFDESTYIAKMIEVRKLKDIEFADSTKSRFNVEERVSFHGLNYFNPDPYYRLDVTFTLDTSSLPFKMPTNTERTPNYRIYGFLDFEIHDTTYRLTAYQNMDYKDDTESGGYLFIPFSDKTNGDESYGAGRYIDIIIPVEKHFVLDFNKSYNPYCAYSERWSCPLVPFENYLETAIPAGEKKYKH